MKKKRKLFEARESQFAIPDSQLSRRDFLKLAALGLGALACKPGLLPGPAYAAPTAALGIPDFPDAETLGRVAQGVAEVKARPELESQTIATLYEDAVFPWLGETTSALPAYVFNNQKWVQMPDGYIYAPMIQPVQNRPNKPVSSLRQTSLGPGMWVEVTVPWVQGRTAPRDTAPNFMLQPGDRATVLYYASIYPATKTATDDQGRLWYSLDELEAPMYARAEGLRVITADEVAPISPDVEDKQIVVDLTRNLQTLVALENGREAYYAVISSGGRNSETGAWSTPVGEHPIWRKRIGMRMGGGDLESGFDLTGVGWTSLFSGHGEAIHSTHWHNDFGIPKSHGCINARPEDAKWLFRWTTPIVEYPLGDKQVVMPGGTRVKVIG